VLTVAASLLTLQAQLLHERVARQLQDWEPLVMRHWASRALH
jgi:hypothetical protein